MTFFTRNSGEEERLAGAETAAAQGEDQATQPTNEEEKKEDGKWSFVVSRLGEDPRTRPQSFNSHSPSRVDCSSGEEDKEDFESNWYQGVESFDDMGLREEILRGIYSYGFKEPSKIQQKGILPVIQGRDTIA